MDDILTLKKLFNCATVWLCCCLSLLFPIHVAAQELTLNTPITSQLGFEARDTWTFMAVEGQILSFAVVSEDGLDPILSIFDQNDERLLYNDDVAYPDNRNAIIEAFTAPYTGVYTVSVTGYGSTAGTYTLSMLPGYSSVAYEDAFGNSPVFESVDLGTDGLGTISVDKGTLVLTQESINQHLFALTFSPQSSRYYIRTTINDINGAQGWGAGIVFNYLDSDTYHLFQINQNGAWRLLRVEDGEDQILRDWGIHPAIRPGITTFSLGILVNGSVYDAFYDDAYLGTVVDATAPDGQLGVSINTVDAIGSTVTGRFDDLFVTTSTISDADKRLFPEQLIATGTNYTIRELERRYLIPAGGSLRISLEDSFAQKIEPGVDRFSIGNDMKFTNLAIGATVTWDVANTILNGCGLVVRDAVDQDNYVLAFVDSVGGAGLSLRDRTKFTNEVYVDQLELDAPPYRILLIAIDSEVSYYLNGAYIGTIAAPPAEGGIGEAIINFERISTECRYRNLWVWSWE